MLSPRMRSNIKKFRKLPIKDIKRIRGSSIAYGSYALQSTVPGCLTSRQIESVRRVFKRGIKKSGRLWIRVFPDIPKTKKPEKTRMGKGKGRIYLWFARVFPGKVIFEISGVSTKVAKDLFKKASYKLPFPTRLIYY